MTKIVVILVLAHGIIGWGGNPAETGQDQMRACYNGVQPFPADYMQ